MCVSGIKQISLTRNRVSYFFVSSSYESSLIYIKFTEVFFFLVRKPIFSTMGNKPVSKGAFQQFDSAGSSDDATQVTIKGIVLSVSEDTKRIQLLNANGKLTNQFITVHNDCIESSDKINFKKSTSNNSIILCAWLRPYDITTLMDKHVIKQILKYASYEFSVRISMPLSLGKAANNNHYLCIRQIQVFSAWNQFIKLSFKDGSTCIKRGSQGRTPYKCIDGDLSIGHSTVNCPDYTDIHENNSETHWMEFTIDDDSRFIRDMNDIGRIKIHNRGDGYKSRIVGCIVELYKDGIVVQSWTFKKTQDEYEFYVDC